MATTTITSAPTNSSTAEFRAWGSALSSTFSTIGLIKTSDSGQIDWLAVSAPSLANTKQGYEIWRFNDSLQATSPVFIKVSYGSGSATVYPSIWIEIGKGSDGGGNLTTVVLSSTQIDVATNTPTIKSTDVSGSSNRLCIVGWQGSPNGLLLAIERTHNSSGSFSGDGLMYFSHVGASLVKISKYISLNSSTSTSYLNWNIASAILGSGYISPDVNLYAVRCWTPGESVPSYNLVSYIATDFPDNITISVKCFDNIYRTYKIPSVKVTSIGYGNPAGNAIAYLWE